MRAKPPAWATGGTEEAGEEEKVNTSRCTDKKEEGVTCRRRPATASTWITSPGRWSDRG